MSILSAIKEKAAETVETVKDTAIKGATIAADGIATLSQLSPKQVEEIENQRQEYLKGQTDNKEKENETVARCLQSIAIEITQTYLPEDKLYLPVLWETEHLAPKTASAILMSQNGWWIPVRKAWTS